MQHPSIPLKGEFPANGELPAQVESMLLVATVLVLEGVLGAVVLFRPSDSAHAPAELAELTAAAITLAALGILAGWRARRTWRLAHQFAITASERLSAFHAAMSAVNRLILQRPEPSALFEGVCEICVNRAGARRALISLAGNDASHHAHASWGRHDGAGEVSKGDPSSTPAPMQKALLALAMHCGEPVLVNDTLKDGQTVAWRDWCAKHGMLALAAIPLTRAGMPVGMLLLYAGTKDFFGNAVVPLLAELGADVSFALDNADKERASLAGVQARLRSEAASHAKTEFLGRMSHELRTPLNAMLGFAQLLATDTSPSLALRHAEWVRLINQAGWHLLGMVDDVMDISGIESGRVEVVNKPCAIAPLVREAIALSQPMALAHEVSLREDAPFAPDIGALVDPTRLRQVLINLFSNACKYNRPRGTVTVHVSGGLNEVVIDVVDNGRGMTDDQLAHLFEPFNRLGQEDVAIEGTGIGLTLSRHLVASMKGTLEFRSRPKSGTRARVSFPACELPLPSPQRLAAKVLALRPEALAPAVVLYIEDDEVNRLVVEVMLSRVEGVTLLLAENGHMGLLMAAQRHPDLVLLDMHLPDLSGLEVLAALRADPSTADLKVVSLSANALPADIADAKSAGALDYWTKPLDLKSFQRDVTHLLNERAAGVAPVVEAPLSKGRAGVAIGIG